MLLGRYIPLGLMLAIAGSFTVKDRKKVIEPIKTHGFVFTSVLLVMTFLLTALTFFPFLVMGPLSIGEKMRNNPINTKTIFDSIIKMNPYYLAKNNAVMFTVEVGFIITLVMGFFPDISENFIHQDQIFYFEIATILIATVWFSTFSESLSEAQAKGRVDSLRSLENTC
jgi:hypothetical protein